MKTLLSLVFLFFFPALSYAQIIETATIDPIVKAFDNTDQDIFAEDILIVFDVDGVLITPKDEILKHHNKKHLEEIQRTMGIWGRWEEPYQKKIFATIWLNREDEVVDPKLSQHIRSLQTRGIKVVALTHCFTGKFGDIPSMETWRSNELKHHGYTLTNSWSAMPFHVFDQFPQKSKGTVRFPTFYEGILFTCNMDKGQLLEAFLKHVNFHPKKIIFIDDTRKNVESVEAFAKRADIDYIGFNYTAIKNRPKVPLNKERAALQFATLEKDVVWLSDVEADTQLKKRSRAEKSCISVFENGR